MASEIYEYRGFNEASTFRSRNLQAIKAPRIDVRMLQ